MVRGGMEGQGWRCRSDWSECGGMVAQRVVPQPRKEKKKKKETTTGSTDSTDFTKLQSRDTTERGTKS